MGVSPTSGSVEEQPISWPEPPGAQQTAHPHPFDPPTQPLPVIPAAPIATTTAATATTTSTAPHRAATPTLDGPTITPTPSTAAPSSSIDITSPTRKTREWLLPLVVGALVVAAVAGLVAFFTRDSTGRPGQAAALASSSQGTPHDSNLPLREENSPTIPRTEQGNRTNSAAVASPTDLQPSLGDIAQPARPGNPTPNSRPTKQPKGARVTPAPGQSIYALSKSEQVRLAQWALPTPPAGWSVNPAAANPSAREYESNSQRAVFLITPASVGRNDRERTLRSVNEHLKRFPSAFVSRYGNTYLTTTTGGKVEFLFREGVVKRDGQLVKFTMFVRDIGEQSLMFVYYAPRQHFATGQWRSFVHSARIAIN